MVPLGPPQGSGLTGLEVAQAPAMSWGLGKGSRPWVEPCGGWDLEQAVPPTPFLSQKEGQGAQRWDSGFLGSPREEKPLAVGMALALPPGPEALAWARTHSPGPPHSLPPKPQLASP